VLTSTLVPPYLDKLHLALSMHQLGSCFEKLKSFTGKKELQKLSGWYTNLQNHASISIKQVLSYKSISLAIVLPLTIFQLKFSSLLPT